MPDLYLPITAYVAGRLTSREDVLAYEHKRALKVAKRLDLTTTSRDHEELIGRIVDRKLELGHDALRHKLRGDLRISGAMGTFGAAVSRGRRRVVTTILRCEFGACELAIEWYREHFRDDERAMLAASPDHWIFHQHADGTEEVTETAAASPVVVQMFFTDDDRTVRTAPGHSYPVEWAGAALTRGGKPMGGVRHRFRDLPSGGFEIELNVEFPTTTLPPMVAAHGWHLASEFSNWLEFANGIRQPAGRGGA